MTKTKAYLVIVALVIAGAWVAVTCDNSRDTLTGDFLQAAYEGNLEELRILSKRGADPSLRGELRKPYLNVRGEFLGEDVSALDCAALKGHLHILDYLLAIGQSPVNSNLKGRTPIWFAAAFNQPRAIQTLVKNGANVNQQTTNGRSPLHIACATQSLEAASKLIEIGASVDIQDHSGNTPLSLALLYSRKESIGHLLTEAEKKSSPSYIRPAEGDPSDRDVLALVALLVRNGAAIELQNEAKMTSLSIAVIVANDEVVQTLLSRKGRDKADISGRTALYWAVLLKRSTIAQRLMDAGSDPYWKAMNGKSPYDLMTKELRDYLHSARRSL